jgi:hypothetical protein
MTVGQARTQVQNLEVPMTVHSHAVPAIFGEKQNVYGTGDVERVDVNTLSIDLRFNYAEVIFTGPLRYMNMACPRVCSRHFPLPCEIVCLNIGDRCGRSLRLRHGVLTEYTPDIPYVPVTPGDNCCASMASVSLRENLLVQLYFEIFD